MQGRTYKYMEKEPLFPFGFGLSYTTFEYADLKLSCTEVEKGQSIQAECTLSNTGRFAAEEVVQLYVSDIKASVAVPNFALQTFKRIHLAPGAKETVKFEITPDMMQIVNASGEKVLEPGQFRVFIGGASPMSRSKSLGATLLSKEFTVQ